VRSKYSHSVLACSVKSTIPTLLIRKLHFYVICLFHCYILRYFQSAKFFCNNGLSVINYLAVLISEEASDIITFGKSMKKSMESQLIGMYGNGLKS